MPRFNHLLGVDGQQEAAVALVGVGDGVSAPPAPALLPDLELPTAPLSPRIVRYPEIEEAHRDSSFASSEAVIDWRERIEAVPAAVPERLFDAPVEQVVRDRRSARSFGRGWITRSQLEAALAAAEMPVPGDSFPPGLVDLFLIVNAVEGVERGAYGPALELIRAGDFRAQAGELALGQLLAAEAPANVYFVSDLNRLFASQGKRGYRVAQMAGGIAGGRIELTATAGGLGATGLTFFDDEVTSFFQPAAEDRQVLYLAALGQARR